MTIEDMASSRLQDVFTKVSDVYGNKIRNFARALVGRSKFELVKIPMKYKVESCSEAIFSWQPDGASAGGVDSPQAC